MFSFKTTVKSGLVALAILIAMLSIRIASADDSDFTIGTIIPTPTHSFHVPYTAERTEVLTFTHNPDVCEYWAVTPLGDWYYGYIVDPIVTYELTFWTNETVVVDCTSREPLKFIVDDSGYPKT